MVTESPTETIKSTVPAASPPNTMLAKSIAAFTSGPVGRQCQEAAPCTRERPLILKIVDPRWSFFWRAGPDRLRFALILHMIDLADDLLMKLPVGALHHLGKIFVHDDIAGFRINHDRALRAVEFPAKERLHGGIA